MSSILSIYTLYNYDNTLFDDMVLPGELDAEILTDNIILELSELELLYNDPEFMKFAIARWSNKELANWQKLYATTVLDYNVIENYNRTENVTDLETRDLNGSDNEIRSLASSGTEGNTTNSSDVGSGSDENDKSVASYNEVSPVLKEQDVTTLGTTKTTATTSSSTFGGTDTGSVNKDTTDEGTIQVTKSANMFGNIGVTTSQQMIEQERKVLEFNIYNHIIQSFKLRFCITVY